MAGPGGALLAYIFMGFVTAGVSYTTGEITAFMPVTGGFVRHATAFVEPALGAATGWNFWYSMAISVPAELSAAATLIQFWDEKTNPAVWITVFLVVIVALNFSAVKLYGEVSFLPFSRSNTANLLLVRGHIRFYENSTYHRTHHRRTCCRSRWRAKGGQTRLPLLEHPRSFQRLSRTWKHRKIPCFLVFIDQCRV
jgi:preprotein translocase subunit Sec61beta